ncbi:hypothetical protein PF005_g33535 [Phytophthora fragariae]|uniref:Uncharacterized protein n=1 Tax=Phytophthora fragariae TaxID=53985 RepID=A0A6A3UF87_9STRA|nr:hypothetical protein PF005_g33535 [Phytophthora fragariae]
MAGQDLGEGNYAVEQEPDLIVQTLTADLETLKQNIMQKEGQGEGAAEREEDAADGEEAVSCCHRRVRSRKLVVLMLSESCTCKVNLCPGGQNIYF